MVDADHYQVNSTRSQCVVDVKEKICTCRKWDLTGMACNHAITTIWDMARNDIRAGIPEEWVSEVYWLDTWKKVFENVIKSIPGPDNWRPSRCPTTLTPPKHHKQVGMPKKKRKKEFGEDEVVADFDNGEKMTRKGTTSMCIKCGNKGHNMRSYKGQGGVHGR
ncbi:uncharacterized protein LOC110880778 [Helianthus annuus]|uniref:uncharacterized protein LOC110880778 n=1 Tax=Helianthus annuus TaxID=4232 RepID=UPI000B9040BE|nr:uncharacterized protein LOC110880778 [Helianthus annuus]